VDPPARGWLCDEVAQTGCLTAGFTPRAAHRTGDWASTIALVAAGAGVALVPRLARIDPPDGVAVRPLRGIAPCRHLFAACRRGAEEGPALRAALTALEDAAELVQAPTLDGWTSS
jgi:DNA-binding transcriptional LysR family regulator